MQILRNLVPITVVASFVIFILPFVDSIQQHDTKMHTKHPTNKRHIQEEIVVHGFLLWASLGFLMPLGILTIRMSNRDRSGRRFKFLFYIHIILQILSALLVTVGAALSIKNFENSFNNTHQRIGIVLYGVMWLQVLTGFIRPTGGSKGRSGWFFVHWVLGTSVSLLGIINVYTGLEAYHKRMSKSVSLWTIIFSAQIILMGFFYIIQDKWDYIRKQGVTLGDGTIQPATSQGSPFTDDQKPRFITGLGP